MDEDDQDYVFYGTPIEREEEISGRKRKMAAEAGQMRSLPPWKQDVRDEDGRKRFHGAFTGGFSAGYYNTVGSKEGWAPQTFTSSRKKKAEVQEQNVYSFLDDDEKAELEGHALGTSLQFDTFGFTAVEFARKQAEKEQSKRPSAIPGPVPDEIVLPATDSIGVKLLLKMGWRHGHSIKDAHADSLYGARREGRKAFLAFSGNEVSLEPTQSQPTKLDSEDTVKRPADDDGVYVSGSIPVFVLHPKQDLHGLGYDPFKHAPEFRERKILRASEGKESRHKKLMKESLFVSNSGKYAPGFGIGALEELDVEDEDVYASGFEFEDTHFEEVEEPSRIIKDSKQHLNKKEEGNLPGFRVASDLEYHLERFKPPVIPNDFEPHHKFPSRLEAENRLDEPPTEVPPPEGNDLRMMIEGFAAFVARCGKLFEDLTREKNRTNPLFSFLYGGSGHDYYARKLWEERGKRADQVNLLVHMNSASSKQKMTAESRGSILGEKPLERSSNVPISSVASAHLQFILSDTFTKPASQIEFSEAAKPFKDDPRKQERFEQFLKDKYQGGLRSYAAGNMTESERARERVDFETAAETIEKGQWKTELLVSNTDPLKQQNKVNHIEENITHTKYPRREEYQWRPYPILCKRFDIADPFLGKPPPLPRVRSKMDSLILMSDTVETIKAETADASRNSISMSTPEFVESGEQISTEETEIVPNNISVERPVDLYKAIFSDDSEDEKENSIPNHVDPEQKAEGANTTLNRLIAGDFLESLGKELGLEVPPDSFNSKDKITISNSREDFEIVSEHDRASAADFTQKSSRVSKEDKMEVGGSKICFEEKLNKSAEHNIGNRFEYARSDVKIPTMPLKYGDGKFEPAEMALKEQRTRKHSRRHRNRSDSSASSDSSDYGGRRDRSRDKERQRGLRERKSRDQSKSDHKSKASASRSSERDKREHRKSRDSKRDKKYH